MVINVEVEVLIDDYSKACTEVVEILNSLPKSQYAKIPSEEIEYYKKNADPEYKFVFQPVIPISEQKILRTTYAILVTIYRDFFINDEQKNILDEILYLNKKIKKS